MQPEHDVKAGDQSDSSLVIAIARGQQSALAEAFRRHAGAVHGHVRRLLGDSGSAEEVLEEVMLRLWAQPDRFEPGRGSLRAVLLTEARSLAVPVARSTGRDIERQMGGVGIADGPGVALASLPKHERDVIELAYFRGYTYREIAKMLKQPDAAVRTRIRAGLEKLRVLLRGA